MTTIPTPVNRTQMWVARGAILVLAVFFIFLRVFAVGEVTGVESGRGPIHIPIYDMMKKALGEILRNAAVHGVAIAEDSNGQQIPPALYP